MNYRFLLILSAVSMAVAQTPAVGQTPLAPQKNAAKQPSSAPPAPVIRFEDASDKAGINFTHSYGSTAAWNRFT